MRDGPSPCHLGLPSSEPQRRMAPWWWIWPCATAMGPTPRKAPLPAGIDLKPWQLESLRRARPMPVMSLFISAEAGAGHERQPQHARPLAKPVNVVTTLDRIRRCSPAPSPAQLVGGDGDAGPWRRHRLSVSRH